MPDWKKSPVLPGGMTVDPSGPQDPEVQTFPAQPYDPNDPGLPPPADDPEIDFDPEGEGGDGDAGGAGGGGLALGIVAGILLATVLFTKK